MSTITLYHYTRKFNLPGILEYGLDTGYAPINKTQGINAVHLTWDNNSHNQKWAEPIKREILLSVQVDTKDKLLITWKQFRKQFRIDRNFINVMEHTGGGRAHENWFLYLGTISPNKITKVHDVQAQYDYNDGDLFRIKQFPKMQSYYPSFFTFLSYESAAI
jgi:hypothetical protein